MRCFTRFWKHIMHTYKDFSMKERFWLPGLKPEGAGALYSFVWMMKNLLTISVRKTLLRKATYKLIALLNLSCIRFRNMRIAGDKPLRFTSNIKPSLKMKETLHVSFCMRKQMKPSYQTACSIWAVIRLVRKRWI